MKFFVFIFLILNIYQYAFGADTEYNNSKHDIWMGRIFEQRISDNHQLQEGSYTTHKEFFTGALNHLKTLKDETAKSEVSQYLLVNFLLGTKKFSLKENPYKVGSQEYLDKVSYYFDLISLFTASSKRTPVTFLQNVYEKNQDVFKDNLHLNHLLSTFLITIHYCLDEKVYKGPTKVVISLMYTDTLIKMLNYDKIKRFYENHFPGRDTNKFMEAFQAYSDFIDNGFKDRKVSYNSEDASKKSSKKETRHSPTYREKYYNIAILDKDKSKTERYKPIIYEGVQKEDFELLTKAKRGKTKVIINALGTVEAGIDLLNKGKNPAIHNFANANSPGAAQEGAVCAALQNYRPMLSMLSQNKKQEDFCYEDANHYIPIDGAVYTPPMTLVKDKDKSLATVASAAFNINRQSIPDKYKDHTRAKIRSTFYAALKNGHDSFVTGAWGTGVFNNDPSDIAAFMAEELKVIDGLFDTVVFAIPGDPKKRETFKDKLNSMGFSVEVVGVPK